MKTRSFHVLLESQILVKKPGTFPERTCKGGRVSGFLLEEKMLKWPIGKMTKERYTELVKNCNEKLTAEEIKNGWHFCWDWDFMLIHKSFPEYAYCRCPGGQNE